MSSAGDGPLVSKRLRAGFSWFWLASLVSAAITFLVAFWGALLLPQALYLYLSTRLPQLALGSIVAAMVVAFGFLPEAKDRVAELFKAASLFNLGWLVFLVSLGPFFLARYFSLPASFLKESYYYSYYASYAAAGFCCIVANAVVVGLWVRQRK